MSEYEHGIISKTSCSRCGRTVSETLVTPQMLPDGWTGSRRQPICPGCELVTWHVHCVSPVDVQGKWVNIGSMPREEWDAASLTYCEYTDLSRAYELDGEDWPTSWTCPRCGGHEFDLVHADYLVGGLSSAFFENKVV